MDGSYRWLGRETVDEGTCLEDCYQYAAENNLEGCCFQFSDPVHRNCRFFEGQQEFVESSNVGQSVSICTQILVTGSPTSAPTPAQILVTGSPTSAPTRTPCVPCDDVETPWMSRNDRDCATSKSIVKRCNTHPNWIKNKYCQLSCYNAGKGYADDVCCNASS